MAEHQDDAKRKLYAMVAMAAQLVEVQPVWKRNILEQSSRPSVSIPRLPVHHPRPQPRDRPDMTETERAHLALKNTLFRAFGRTPQVGDVYKHFTGAEVQITRTVIATDYWKSTVTFESCTDDEPESITWPIRNFAQGLHMIDPDTGDAELTPQFMYGAFPDDMYPTDMTQLPVQIDLFDDEIEDEDILDEDDDYERPYVGLIIPRYSNVIYTHRAGGTSCRMRVEVLWTMGLQLDFTMLADSCEAWLHVIYLWPSPADLNSRARAVLVWPNSD